MFIGAALAGVFMASGCVSVPQTMATNSFLGERSVQYTVHAGARGGDDEDLVNLYVRLCTLSQGKETDCKQSLVLARVDPDAQNNHIHWHDQETFYVAYVDDVSQGLSDNNVLLRPRVKMCKVGEDNSVACTDQPAIDGLLAPSQDSL